MIVGCYSMDLYCDNEACAASNIGFTGRNRTQATREARQAGWSVKHATDEQTGVCFCPSCRKPDIGRRE